MLPTIEMFAFAKRNCLIYFRDRSSVVFSLLGALIVILLYLIFLRNTLTDSIVSALPDMFPYDIDSVRGMVDAWVLSGVIAIVSVTTTVGAFQTMIQDKVDGRYRDAVMTMMSPAMLSASYILSTFAVGLIMSIITFVISTVFLTVTGTPLSVTGMLLTLLLTIPASLSSSIILYAITAGIKSAGAFSGLYTILSVLIGFLTGTYMPLGTMDGWMQNVSSLVPATHIASMMRSIFGRESFDAVFSSAPAGVSDDIWNMMGYNITLFGYDFTPVTSMLYVVGITAVFFVIAVIISRRNV